MMPAVITSGTKLFLAAGSAAFDIGPFVSYLNLGVIVVVLGLSYTRKIRFEGEVKEKDTEIKELKDSLRKYTDHYEQDVVPALIDVTRVAGELVAYLNKHRD